MRSSAIIIFAFCLYTSINAACLFKQLGGCPNYDLSTGVITCPNVCSCTDTSSLCSCGAPSCSCFLDSADVCSSCKPESSPLCSCLSSIDVPCEAKKSFIYYPEVTYPLTRFELNPYLYNTCYSY